MRDFIYLAVMILAMMVLLPIIGKIILYLLPLVAIFAIYIYIKSRKVRQEIEQDPQSYFSQQLYQQEREKEPVIRNDVIDAEYTEKVIETEEQE
ncbi:MAG: hypothetical protein IJL94_02475 [Erysipelotrichaceae bacterium]|nr:hypothetical protein [Erysipelotrichaceae bacterium]